MDLFMLTADAASTHGGRLGGTQCRVATLELALHVRDCLAQFKPDTDLREHCPDVVDQVRGLSTAIHYYIMETKSGLYYESPWTMGCHMLEFLTTAYNIGLSICKRYAVFQSILHLYNAMRRFNIKELSIPKNYELEKLCQMFVWPALREHASTKLSGYTAKARALLTEELSAETPLSRLNMLKLFQAYAEMLSGFGRLARPDLEPAYRKRRVWMNEMKHGLVLGRFAVEDTLELIDLSFGGTTKEKRRLARHPLLLGAAKMFNDMQEGRQPEDAKLGRFLWDLA
ncbi:hypothetical protein K4K57_006336 [Colletotrichum sp. SAR 10_99]|nr:hypothetical protein K4K55_006335 [Colletotrichum sp. SAR 10_96]KAJ5010996.1 hypothetical protein K4K57_006336 [Colletotrichum sp. SAR 10_99]